jgi:hypothetical protein
LPNIGDCGAVGYPSNEDTPATWGDLNSFVFIYRGFRAIGFASWELELTRAFLEAHEGHRIGHYLEGEEYAGELPPHPPYDETSEFDFSKEGFLKAFYQVSCKRCDARFRAEQLEWLRDAPPVVITPYRARQFLDRIDVDPLNFHRVFGCLDPYADQKRLIDFI